MALTEKHRKEIAALAAKNELTKHDKARLLALRHFHNPDAADQRELDRIIADPAAPPPAPPKPPALTPLQQRGRALAIELGWRQPDQP